jgi:hypothetical protein
VDLEVGDPAGRPAKLCALLTASQAKVGVSLGGQELKRLPDEHGWVCYDVPASCLRTGSNVASLTLQEDMKTERVFSARDIVKLWGVRGKWKSDAVFEELTPAGLRTVDRGTNGGDYHYRSFGWAVEPGGKAAITVRAKHVTGWSSFAFANGRNEERLMLFPDRIRCRNSGLEYAMDTTTAFHDYRVELSGQDVRVFVDGVLRIDGTGTYTAPAAGGRTMVLLGAATSTDMGEALWERVKLETTDVALQDLVLVLPDGAAVSSEAEPRGR